jgi:hypothetical protein
MGRKFLFQQCIAGGSIHWREHAGERQSYADIARLVTSAVLALGSGVPILLARILLGPLPKISSRKRLG